jgi:predicted Co/Zn/Cd cation transporter (cation efflux family)
MVDGVYSTINFISALIAAKVLTRISRGPDAQRPFGYAAEESLYVALRSMVLAGYLLFALLNASSAIVSYIRTGQGSDLIFGPIIAYTALMVVLCFGLATYHRRNWIRTGKTSALLKVETQAAVVDGSMSAGAGLALMILPFLKGTPLQVIIPVGDSLVVFVLTIFIVLQPMRGMRAGFVEMLGISDNDETVANIRSFIEHSLAGSALRITDIIVSPLGRTRLVVVQIAPDLPITATETDNLHQKLLEALSTEYPKIQLYLLIGNDQLNSRNSRVE